MIKSKLFKYSLFISLVYAFYYGFIFTPQYKSEMLLSIKQSDQIQINSPFNILRGFSGQNSEIFELEKYLQSKAGLSEIESIFKDISIEEDNPFLFDFVTWLRNLNSRNSEEYERKVSLRVDVDSGMLISESYGFSPDNSQYLNMSVLIASKNYFDRKIVFDASITLANKICSLVNKDISDENKDINVMSFKQFDSPMDAYISIYDSYSKACLDLISNDISKSELSKLLEGTAIPKSFLSDIDINSKKEAIAEIYLSASKASSFSDKITLLSEPSLPSDSQRKNTLLYSLILFLTCLSIGFAIDILRKISKEYG